MADLFDPSQALAARHTPSAILLDARSCAVICADHHAHLASYRAATHDDAREIDAGDLLAWLGYRD